jgi:hypothetical protein
MTLKRYHYKPKGIKAINEIIEAARKKHVLGMAKDFISSLE